MQPHLSLAYNSGSGNGVLGVGWTLAGVSSITRCRQSLSTEGVSQGVHFTDFSSTIVAQRDRFCLDGQKLMAVAGANTYGQDGVQYRTENDHNLKIVSNASSPVAAAEGPDSFTVQSPDGKTATYSPIAVTRYSATDSPTNGGLKAAGTVRATWVLTSESDASGNGVNYYYGKMSGAANPSDGSCDSEPTQVLLCSIAYTTFNGDTTLAARQVTFAYDNTRTDNEFTWTSGVQSVLANRLATIKMSAPDPTATVPVWEYVINYQSQSSAFSGRSLLASVQRCAMQEGSGAKSPGTKGDCTWKKQFGYTQAPQMPSFVAANNADETNVEIGETLISTGSDPAAPVQNYPGYALSERVSCGANDFQTCIIGPYQTGFGIPPMLKVLSPDANGPGNGVDSLLLQRGSTDAWLSALNTWSNGSCSLINQNVSAEADLSASCKAQAPANVGPHLLEAYRGSQPWTTSTGSSPFGKDSDLTSNLGGDFVKLNNEFQTDSTRPLFGPGPYYPNGTLEGLIPSDVDGNGTSSLLMNDVNNGQCARILDWSTIGSGFSDRGVNYGGCTLPQLGLTWNSDDASPPNSRVPSGDFTGEGRVDVTKKFAVDPTTPSSAKIEPIINIGGNKVAPDPTTATSTLAASCPVYAVDLYGDGRLDLFGQAADGAGNPTLGTSCLHKESLNYNPFSTSAPNDRFTQSPDTTGALPQVDSGPSNQGVVPFTFPNSGCPHEWNPSMCAGLLSHQALSSLDTRVWGDARTLHFGDFNGGGLPSVVEADPVRGTLWLQWNTGNGFSAPVLLGSPGWMAGAFSIQVADLTNNGRDDLVVFHEKPTRGITLMMSTGNPDGTHTFTSTDIQAINANSPADPGLRTAAGWTNSVLGDFHGDGKVDIATLVPDLVHTNTLADGQSDNGHGGQVYTHTATLTTLEQPTNQASMPGTSSHDQPQADLLATVSDEGANFTRETVSYSSPGAPSDQPGWTDKSESGTFCQTLSYPQRCVTKGLITVRSVTSADTTANSPVANHRVLYSYEEPVADMRDRGFLGFHKVRVFDPTRLQQTVTMYDNATEIGTAVVGTSSTLYAPGYYPGSEQPRSVTTITAIPSASSPQTLPKLPPRAGVVSTNARVDQTVFNTRLVHPQYSNVYTIEPVAGSASWPWPNAGSPAPAQLHTQWETTVSMDAFVNDPNNPTSDYMWGATPAAGTTMNFPLAPPASAVSNSSTVLSTCDASGNNPGGSGNTGACIDAYGNVTATTVQSSTGTGSTQSNGALVQTVSTFNNLTTVGLWRIGQLASSTVTDTEPDYNPSATPPVDPPVSRLSVYDYDNLYRLQHAYACQQVSPSSSGTNCGSFELVSTTTLGYDQYGNVTSTATTAIGPDGHSQVTRQVNTEYDRMFGSSQPDERIFPSQTWVPAYYPSTASTSMPVAPSSWHAIQPAYGVVVASEDVNGVQSQATYDDQGRPLTTTPPGALLSPPSGVSTSIAYAARTDAALGNTGMQVTTTAGAAKDIVSTDSAGRTLLNQHLGFDGNLVDTATNYDLLGRAVQTSRPYTDGSPVSSVYFGGVSYDGLDRPIQTTTPDGKTTKRSWTFFTASQGDANGTNHQVAQAFTTDPNNHQMVVDTDVDGRVIASGGYNYNPAPATGSSWQLQTFHYQSFGLQDTAITPAGAKSTTSYDSIGRITASTSPDAGTMNGFSYDGFGELMSQNHVNGSNTTDATTSYNYDTLGRQTNWSTNDNNTITSATFTYDTATNGLGKLATASSGDGVQYTYYYDGAGRQNKTTEQVGLFSYTTRQTYNGEGLPATLNYPSIGTNTNPGMTLTYGYNNADYLNTLNYATANPTSQAVSAQAGLWKINSRYADGMLATAGTPASTTGVSVAYQQYPDSGLLKEITAVPGANFANQSFANAVDLKYAYYDNGSLQTRTDNVNGRTETYGYDYENRLTSWAASTCSPAPCTASASATSTRTSSYIYDADGNLQNVLVSPALGAPSTSAQANGYGPNSTTGPTSQGGPHALNTQTAGGTTTAYTYDTHGRQTGGAGRTLTYNACNLPTTVSNNTGAWTLKYGPFCERAMKMGPDGTTIYVGGLYEHRQNAVGTQDVFIVPGVGQVSVDGQGNNTVQYQVGDAQGSTGIVVDGATGTLDGSPQFYEPFGAQINKDGTPYTGTNTTPVTKGFTGQEQDSGYGLDNYNGRLYDPVTKRFLTTDPKVSNPLFSQAWNPYSYVDNNPTNATDPTGFEGEGDNPPIINNEGLDDSSGVLTYTDPATGQSWLIDENGNLVPNGTGIRSDGTTAVPKPAKSTAAPIAAGTGGDPTTAPVAGPAPSADGGEPATYQKIQQLGSQISRGGDKVEDTLGEAGVIPGFVGNCIGGMVTAAGCILHMYTPDDNELTTQEKVQVAGVAVGGALGEAVGPIASRTVGPYLGRAVVAIDEAVFPAATEATAPASAAVPARAAANDAAALGARIDAQPGSRVIYVGPPNADGSANAALAITEGNVTKFGSKTDADFVAIAREQLELDNPGQFTSIGSATHGTRAGGYAATDADLGAGQFLAEDVSRNPDSAVFDMRSPLQVEAYESATGAKVDGWCWSVVCIKN